MKGMAWTRFKSWWHIIGCYMRSELGRGACIHLRSGAVIVSKVSERSSWVEPLPLSADGPRCGDLMPRVVIRNLRTPLCLYWHLTFAYAVCRVLGVNSFPFHWHSPALTLPRFSERLSPGSCKVSKFPMYARAWMCRRLYKRDELHGDGRVNYTL